MNKGCRVNHCGNMPKFEVKASEPLLVCRNHLAKAIEESVTDPSGILVALNQVSDVEYLQIENKRLRQQVRKLEEELNLP